MLRNFVAIGLLVAVALVPTGGLLMLAVRSLANTAPTLGPAPRTCPTSSAPALVTRASYGAVRSAGSVPVWGFLINGSHPTLHWGVMADVPGAFEPSYGWGHKMLWALRPWFHGTLTLRGDSLNGHAPLWFDATEYHVAEVPTRVLPLNALWQQASSGPVGSGPSFPGAVYVPAAGCYYLEARWPGGRWRGDFSAGR